MSKPTLAGVRQLIMALPEVTAAPHMDREAFRAGGRIFATLRADGLLNVKLPQFHQETVCAAEPHSFKPVNGGWGRMGWTTIDLGNIDPSSLASSFRTAWQESREPRASMRKSAMAGSRRKDRVN